MHALPVQEQEQLPRVGDATTRCASVVQSTTMHQPISAPAVAIAIAMAIAILVWASYRMGPDADKPERGDATPESEANRLPNAVQSRAAGAIAMTERGPNDRQASA